MIRLTQTVQRGGCAAKVAALELRKILSLVDFPPKDSSILVDGSGFDDAAIQIINAQLALVHTMDFFTPILDTPRLFGRVAAVNALSDVYAMGGTPKTALAILAFPVADLSAQIIADVLQGASDALKDAGVSLVGGHSIDDDTLKFGLSVTGFVHPQKVWSNQGAKPGDRLILTKPLGTGTLTAALKRSELTEAEISDAVQSMCLLNRAPEILSDDCEHVRAATDITGFGLLGHAKHVADGSQVSLRLSVKSLPVFARALECIERGFLTKAHRTNREYTDGAILNLHRFTPTQQQILFDPQTSGGLLLSVKPEFSDEVLKTLKTHFESACIVGEVCDRQSHACLLE